MPVTNRNFETWHNVAHIQTDNPMIAFISDMLEETIESLMKMVLQRSIVDQA